MDYLYIFPHLNASLNAMSAIFLLSGLYFIMRSEAHRHRASMLTAASLSGVFFVSYVTYHSLRTYYFGLGPTKFSGEGLSRPIYFTILTSHTILAAGVAPFIIWTLVRALKGKFDAHRRLARLVFPIWIYVSVTGVIVYLMLYHLYRPV